MKKKTVELLRSHAIKVTGQRVEILRLLTERPVHLSAEEIYRAIAEQFPAVSLATVYTTLELFEKKGLINEVRLIPERACYEARNEWHHHLYCKKCGRIIDIDMPGCHTFVQGHVAGHTIESVQAHFYGVCRECQ